MMMNLNIESTNHIIRMQKESTASSEKVMISLIDKLCDHLTNEKVKVLIDHGFDQWETITYMKGEELVQLGYTPEECIIIMVAVNSNAAEFHLQPIFSEEKIKAVIQASKEKESETLKEIEQEEANQRKSEEAEGHPPQFENPKQGQSEELDNQVFPVKQITEQVMLKGVRVKQKPGQKVNFSQITLIDLEQKQITHIRQMDRVPILLNLYLNKNYIRKIEGLQPLKRLKVLKLDGNRIKRIQNLEELTCLEQLYLNDNYLDRLENINNQHLQYLNISSQKSTTSFTFDEDCCQNLGYCLETLECNRNRINDMRSKYFLRGRFKAYEGTQQIIDENNLLEEIGDLSDTINSMERLKYLDFRGNPLASVPKYRDYIVICLRVQLDDKKILPTQRQYLVKLYSLKHAKQVKEESASNKVIPTSKELDLQGKKVEEGTGGHQQYSHGTDLRGNVAYINTKIMKK